MLTLLAPCRLDAPANPANLLVTPTAVGRSESYRDSRLTAKGSVCFSSRVHAMLGGSASLL